MTARSLAVSQSAPELPPAPQVIEVAALAPRRDGGDGPQEEQLFAARPSYLGALEKRSYLRKVVRSLEERSLRPELRGDVAPRMGREDMRLTAKSHSLEIFRRFQMTRVSQRLRRLEYADLERAFFSHADSTGRLSFFALSRFLADCGISRQDFAVELFKFLKTPGSTSITLKELRLGLAALLYGEIQEELHSIFAKLPSGYATKEELKRLFLEQMSPYSRTLKHFSHEADRQAGEIIVYADSNSDGRVSVADIMYEGVANAPFLRTLVRALHLGGKRDQPPATAPARSGSRSPSRGPSDDGAVPPLPARRGFSPHASR